MTASGLYVKLDAEYPTDDEFIEAGAMPELLYVRGLCFCKRKLLNGTISRNQLSTVALGIPTPLKHAASLVDVGLWEATETGWFIRAWFKRNKSVEQILEDREVRRMASVEGNHTQHHVGEGKKRSPKCELCRSVLPPKSAPKSDPISLRNRLQESEEEEEPKEEEEEEPIPADSGLGETQLDLVPKPAPKRADRFREFYEMFPVHKGIGSAGTAYVKALKTADHEAIMAGLARNLADLSAAKARNDTCPHPATWLNAQRWNDEPSTGPSTVTHPATQAGNRAKALDRLTELRRRIDNGEPLALVHGGQQ
jgi:hypothetical protein